MCRESNSVLQLYSIEMCTESDKVCFIASSESPILTRNHVEMLKKELILQISFIYTNFTIMDVYIHYTYTSIGGQGAEGGSRFLTILNFLNIVYKNLGFFIFAPLFFVFLLFAPFSPCFFYLLPSCLMFPLSLLSLPYLLIF